MAPDLRPYAPALVLEWASESPDATYRRLPGSMVFCDVSGFTALSERLAKKGRIGSEQLSDVLNAVFTELLTRMAAYGGCMLKYGGDAILVFFQGDGHDRRAVAAAAAARRGLRQVRGPSGTRTGLKMSVGVHTGEFDFFLVGSQHRELVVAGPAATRTCEMEAAADAGEILLSPQTAAALPASALGPRKGQGVLLARAPAAPHAAVDAGDPSVDAARYVPVAVSRHVGAGGLAPEHRHIAVAFIRFGDIDRRLAEDGPDAVADDLARLMALVQDTLEEHGVTFVTCDIAGDGGKVMAACGAPTGWSNNDERLLRAVRAVVDAYSGLPLHVGVNRGAVFSGDVGAPFSRAYTVLGDAVNTAARVMSKAGAGEIRAMPSVLDRSATAFEMTECEPFMAKGKAEPLVTFSVGAALGRRRDEGERLPLIGRADELAVLMAAADEARAGRGSVVTIRGEEGTGKTRLIEEVREQVGPAVRVLAMQGARYDAASPFFGIRQLLRQVVDEDAGVTADALMGRLASLASVGPWAPLLQEAVGAAVKTTREVDQLAATARTARRNEVIAAVVAEAAPGPAVVVVDDAQWLDEASLAFVNHLASRLARRPWLVLVASSDDAIALGSTIELGPLASADGAALARAASARPLLPADAQQIAERSDGNPLFLLEITRAVASRRDLDGLPDSVGALVAARIDELSPIARDSLRAAAVLGPTFDVDLYRLVVGDDDDSHLLELDELIELADGVGRFRQAVFQQTAYDGLAFRRRRELHGKVADLIESRYGGDERVELSLHDFEAQRYDAAWRHAVAAADRARDRGALGDAATLYRRALTAARHVRGLDAMALSTAWKELGRALVMTGELPAAADAYRRSQRLGRGDAQREVELLINMTEVAIDTGDLRGSRRWLRRALSVVDAPEYPQPDHLSRAQFLMVKLLMLIGDAESIAWAERAVETSLRGEVVSTQASAFAALGGAAMTFGIGDPVAPTERALALYRACGSRSGEGTALNNLGLIDQRRGAWASAAERFRQSAVAHAAAGDALNAASSAHNGAEVLADQGHVVEAESIFEDAIETFEAGQARYAYFYALRNLAVVRARLGHVDAALTMIEESRQAFAGAGVDVEVADSDGRLALVLLVAARASEALEALDRAEASGANDQWAHRTARLRASALAQLGRREEALAEIRRAVELAAGIPYELALANDVLGRLEPSAEAARAAAEGFAALGVLSASVIPLDALRASEAPTPSG